MKTKSELEKLNTKRLLRYYKSEREKFYNSGFICDCGCGEFVWEINQKYSDVEQKYNELKNYLKLIKSILDTRENIKIKKKKIRFINL